MLGISGSRKYAHLPWVWVVMNFLTNRDHVIVGDAEGVDDVAVKAIKSTGVSTYRQVIPDWGSYGKAAGPIRNRIIVSMSTGVICFWDGSSRGTLSTIQHCLTQNKPYLIITDQFDPVIALAFIKNLRRLTR